MVQTLERPSILYPAQLHATLCKPMQTHATPPPLVFFGEEPMHDDRHTMDEGMPRRSTAKAGGRDAVTHPQGPFCKTNPKSLFIPISPVHPVQASPTKSNLIQHF